MLNSPHAHPHPHPHHHHHHHHHHGMTSLPEVTRATYSNCVQARVMAAPAFGGEKMYQVKLSCRGQSSSMYKSKEDFRNVINMLKLVGAIAARTRGTNGGTGTATGTTGTGTGTGCCQVCRDCSVMTKVRCVDEENLNEFLAQLLRKLRSFSKQCIDECSAHRGVINVLKEFLSVRNGKFFCETLASSSPEDDDNEPCHRDHPSKQLAADADDPAFGHGEHDDKSPFCSLHRTLSQKFAAFDSVC